MELLVNDLSMHGQFAELRAFKQAIDLLMRTRSVAKRYGRELNCHRGLASAQVMRGMNMQEVANSLSIDERRVLMRWLTQEGPFWEDVRVHTADDWMEWNGEIVTDTALGEAALCCLYGIDRRLVSFAPSNWEFSPVAVSHVIDSDIRRAVEVVNYWDPDIVERDLRGAPRQLASWQNLAVEARNRFATIKMGDDAFEPLSGCPFSLSAARRILSILEILDRFAQCFDVQGERSREGHEVYRDFFTGKKGDGGRGALFSDSSDDEKAKFATEMSFRHPENRSNKLFCPWHGKIQTPPLRVHFSWPVRSGEVLYVMYVGPKITKR
jgi:hypothetical protein